jgi:hypothetical protein
MSLAGGIPVGGHHPVDFLTRLVSWAVPGGQIQAEGIACIVTVPDAQLNHGRLGRKWFARVQGRSALGSGDGRPGGHQDGPDQRS